MTPAAEPSGRRSRRVKRIEISEFTSARSAHLRRTWLTRAGVLAGFVLAMVIYPVFGTIAPYADAVEEIPGVVRGSSPTTAFALLGPGPQLASSNLPLPTIDDEAKAIAASTNVLDATPLPDCDPSAAIVGSNGRLSASSLCLLWDGREQLQPEAAIAFSALNDHFRSVFGRNMCVDDTYRSLSQQYSTKASQGFLAAAPGTSMHGWGLAVDFCRSDSSGSKYQWLAENAPVYGFINPPWAKSVKYEPWHWEYERGVRKYYDITWGS